MELQISHSICAEVSKDGVLRGCSGQDDRNRARTAGGIPASRTAHDMDNEFDSGCESGRFFCCPGSAAYGILEAEILVVEKERFTTFLLLLAASICRVLPRFAE